VNIQQDQQQQIMATAAGMSTSQHQHAGGFADAHMWRTNLDVQRHKEVCATSCAQIVCKLLQQNVQIIVKAISTIVLLLLKHLRLNHVYQFEHVAQHLVFANCIPLILKFFDQNIHAYVMRQTDIEPLNYPHSVVYHAKSGGADILAGNSSIN
jgi:hypothetical protein